MAIQLLKFRRYANGLYRAVIDLDDTDPDSPVRTYVFGPLPNGVTENTYLAGMRQEIKAQVQAENAQRADQGTPLTGEGGAL